MSILNHCQNARIITAWFMKKHNEDVKYLWNIEIKSTKPNGSKKWVGLYE